MLVRFSAALGDGDVVRGHMTRTLRFVQGLWKSWREIADFLPGRTLYAAKARGNHLGLKRGEAERHPGLPAIQSAPKLTTAIFGLGGHDLQPRHLIAAFKNMEANKGASLIYLG